jgi:hypothetical protein
MKPVQTNLKVILERNLNPALDMLAKMMDYCPEELWLETRGGFPFWQQVYHAYESMDWWMTRDHEHYQTPDFGKDITADLDQTCTGYLTRAEMARYAQELRIKVVEFFREMNDATLLAPYHDNSPDSNCDMILCQIRHLQYHIGHCNSILREQGLTAVEWIESDGTLV